MVVYKQPPFRFRVRLAGCTPVRGSCPLHCPTGNCVVMHCPTRTDGLTQVRCCQTPRAVELSIEPTLTSASKGGYITEPGGKPSPLESVGMKPMLPTKPPSCSSDAILHSIRLLFGSWPGQARCFSFFLEENWKLWQS